MIRRYGCTEYLAADLAAKAVAEAPKTKKRKAKKAAASTDGDE